MTPQIPFFHCVCFCHLNQFCLFCQQVCCNRINYSAMTCLANVSLCTLKVLLSAINSTSSPLPDHIQMKLWSGKHKLRAINSITEWYGLWGKRQVHYSVTDNLGTPSSSHRGGHSTKTVSETVIHSHTFLQDEAGWCSTEPLPSPLPMTAWSSECLCAVYKYYETTTLFAAVQPQRLPMS